MAADITATVTKTGSVTTSDAQLRSVSLVAGSTAALLIVRAGGPAGRTVCTVKAATRRTVKLDHLADGRCPGGIHATIAGNAAKATLVYV